MNAFLHRIVTVLVGRVLGVVTHVETQEPLIALTFDDGPDPLHTPRLLRVLEVRGAAATFFMLGEAAARHHDIVEQVARSGHAIGVHSWDHPAFPLIGIRERWRQIRASAEALSPYGQRLFRPPYGMQNLVTRLEASLLGYQTVMGNVGADDWCGASADAIAQQIEDKIGPGSVVMLHDGLYDGLEESYFDRGPTVEAVRIILDRLSDQYSFVTLPRLLETGRAQRSFRRKNISKEFLNKLHTPAGHGRRY